jgi:hypothetical protein
MLTDWVTFNEDAQTAAKLLKLSIEEQAPNVRYARLPKTDRQKHVEQLLQNGHCVALANGKVEVFEPTPEIIEGQAVVRTETRDDGKVIKHLADGTTVEERGNGIYVRRGMIVPTMPSTTGRSPHADTNAKGKGKESKATSKANQQSALQPALF